MQRLLKSLLLFGLGTLVCSPSYAEAKSRIRLFVPISASYTKQSESSQSESSYTNLTASASGYGLHYIMAMGLGIGYTSSDLKLAYDSDSTKDEQHRKANSVDLSYTMGEELSFQNGLGSVIGGEITYTIPEKSTELSFTDTNASGSAYFLALGYDFGGFELALGYRMNSYKHQFI